MPGSVAHGSQFKQCKQRVKQQIVDNCSFKRAEQSALHVKSRGHKQSSIDYHDELQYFGLWLFSIISRCAKDS